MIKVLKKIYENCISDGIIQFSKNVESQKATTLLETAKCDLATLKDAESLFEKKHNYRLLWSLRYEILRQLIDGVMLMEKVKSKNHQCLFAYACVTHKEWDIDWETIETMRLLRNKVHYEGSPITKDRWNEFKFKFDVYTDFFIRILSDLTEKT